MKSSYVGWLGVEPMVDLMKQKQDLVNIELAHKSTRVYNQMYQNETHLRSVRIEDFEELHF